MIRLLKYLMKIIYAKNQYGKYKIEGWGYHQAILGASFYISMTAFLLLVILSSIFPSLYRLILIEDAKVNGVFFAIIYTIISYLIVRLLIKKDDIKSTTLTRRQIDRAANYFLIYLFSIGILIVFFVMKFLAPIANS